MYFELPIIRQNVELQYDEDGNAIEVPIDDDWIKKKYAFDLRVVRITAFESTTILNNKCTLVYLNDMEVIIYPKDFATFKREILPKYDHLLNQLLILNKLQ